MKKRKINLLLNIATLCLCVCAIAFGVYSAKQASLNVSGTIGFQAHNVNATVSAQIKGDAVNGATASVDGTPRADYATIGNTVNLTGTETTTQSLALTKFYFSDMGESGTPEDIYLKISVTNNSAFNIKAYFDKPEITGVTVSLGEGSSSYVKLGTSTDTKTGYIILKLSLNANASGNYDNLSAENNINLTMHLDKYEDYYVKEITESVYNGSAFADVTTNRLCTQLGHGTKEDLNGAEFEQLQWYAFAVKGTGTNNADKPSFVPAENKSITPQNSSEVWYSLYKVDMTNVDYKGYTFWFIQQYTVGGGYVKDYSGSGKKFNADPDHTTANTYANETYQSDIYKYLNDNSENSCDTRNSTYQLDTGIGKDLYYTLTLSQDTNKRAVSETDTTKKNSTSITVNNNFTSTFWLLNYTELGLAYNQSLGQSDSGKIVKSFSIGMKDGVNVDGTVYGAYWWLRSPRAAESTSAHCVTKYGGFINNVVHDSVSIGVRAAFQIQI